MQASETTLRRLIEGTRQYVVPLFQRPYSWSRKQWKTLWDDVLEKVEHADGRAHFFGSIVTTPAKSVPEGVGKFLLIDGQQRLTTVQVFLAALRDIADSNKNQILRDKINGQYLTNLYEQDDERLKVLPTHDDRAAFRAIIHRREIPDGQLRRCYGFFCERLTQLSPDKLESVHLAIVDRFSLVSITCDEQDNPHLIFESLNAKGAKLTPADLIRNFLFMLVHVGNQERLFRTHWLPIQQALEDHLTEFVRHFLMKDGKILRESEVYFELKDRLAGSTPADVEAFLRVLHRHGMYYARFVDPRRESDRDLAERLDRICRLKVTVAYPFLLRVFDAYESQQLTKQQVVETLKILESFVIRRAVCGRPTNQLRRIFPPVFNTAGGPGPTFVDGLRRQLGGARCPDDAEFKQALTTVPLYATSEKNIRLRLMLECLERSYGHREPADLSQTTIEHVLPQKLTEPWRVELGDDAETVWKRLVDTLGNLTLSAYNPELSNQPYSVKRRLLIESHLDLNQYFQNVDRWDERAILLRSEMLADRALQIWPDVGRSPGSSEPDRPATKPLAVQFRGRRLPCRNWRDGFQKLVEMFEQDQPGFLERLAGEDAFSAIVSFEPARFPRSKFQLGNVFVNTHASAAVLRDWCRRLAERAGLQPSDYGFITPDRNERLSTSS